MLASGGAVVVLLAAFVGGLLLVTSTSLRTMATQTGRGRGVGGATTRTGRPQGDRRPVDAQQRQGRARQTVATAHVVAGEPSALAPPNLYDLAAEDGDPWAAPSAAAASKPTRRAGRRPARPANRNCRSKACSVGEWTLPPLSYLTRAGEQAVNRAEIERRGQTLQESLEQHGVDTALRRHDGRPDGHPLRARARPRRQGRPRHHPAEGHRLRDGGHRRPHPGSDPGAFGDRRRGAEPPTSARRARRPVGVAGGEDVDRSARRRDRQGHRRPRRVPRPRHDAAPADRRRHRRRQVERSQLHHHVAADAHARPTRCV